MRKVLRVDELPRGFFYVTRTHIVEGTGKKFNEKVMMKDERVRSEKRGQVVVHG